MQTIMLVGLARRGVEERFNRAGFFVVTADNATAALGILNAIRVDAFVVDVGDADVGGEKLIGRLRAAPAWRQLPVIVTGAGPEQCERLAQRPFRGAIVTAREFSADAILAALRPLLRAEAAPGDDVPGRHAWGDAEADVPTRTLRRWITADFASQYR